MKAQRDALNEFNDISLKFAEPDADFDALIARQGKLQEYIDQHDLWNLDNKIDVAMDALRLPPGDADVTKLSGGEKRRVALCKILLEEPDMLLLDEPTNHLDAESVQWLEQHLARYTGTVIAVTHDRYFLDNVAQWILELDRGRGIPWKGNYSSWLEQKQRRLAVEQRTEDRRQKAMARELAWIRQSARARQAKSQARINAYEAMLKEGVAEKEREFEILIPAGQRLGTLGAATATGRNSTVLRAIAYFHPADARRLQHNQGIEVVPDWQQRGRFGGYGGAVTLLEFLFGAARARRVSIHAGNLPLAHPAEARANRTDHHRFAALAAQKVAPAAR